MRQNKNLSDILKNSTPERVGKVGEVEIQEKLERLKLILGIEGSDQDALLSFLLQSTERKILNYCNINELPAELEDVLIEITSDAYRARQREMDEGKVAQVNIGDTTIQYSESNFNLMTGAGGTDFLKNYKAQLSRYRKLRW